MLSREEWSIPKVLPVTEEWRLVLSKAADLIRTRGLAKFNRLYGGAMCIHGAISAAAYGNPHESGPLECEAVEAVCRYLIDMRAANVYPDGAAYWNNMPERTAEEVIAALEGASSVS